MLVLAALIKLLGSGVSEDYTLDFHISLEPNMLFSGVHAFAQQVANIISDYLYEILGENGAIKVTLIVEVIYGNEKFDYRKEITETPSKNLRDNLERIQKEMIETLEKDLAIGILRTDKFQSQIISSKSKSKRI